MRGHLPHPVTPGGATDLPSAARPNRGKKRGSYNCGRCGQPKKGHSCHLTPTTTTAATASAVTPTPTASASSASVASPPSVIRPPLPLRQPPPQPRRALSFDDIDVPNSPEPDEDEDDDGSSDPDFGSDLPGSGKLPFNCLWEVLRRLPPPALLSAAKVCKGWRDTSRKLWKAAEELRLRVPAKSPIGFAGSVVQKCPSLLRLSLIMERLGFITYTHRSRIFYTWTSIY